jgi:hypothetical protein
MWDAGQLPVLWFYGEFGATKRSPYRDRFYALALQPMSRNPYPRDPFQGERCLTISTIRKTNGWISATPTASPVLVVLSARARSS